MMNFAWRNGLMAVAAAGVAAGALGVGGGVERKIVIGSDPAGALVMLNKGEMFTLPLVLAASRTVNMLGGTDWGMLQAGVTVSIIPCVGVYLLLQKYYVSGLLSGAVK